MVTQVKASEYAQDGPKCVPYQSIFIPKLCQRFFSDASDILLVFHVGLDIQILLKHCSRL